MGKFTIVMPVVGMVFGGMSIVGHSNSLSAGEVESCKYARR